MLCLMLWPMAGDKTQLRRLNLIHLRISSGTYSNCSSLAMEAECSTKTIMRDIDYLRDFFHAPIEYDPTRHGYVYSEPNYKISAIDINEGDLFALCIAEKTLQRYRNTPVYHQLNAVFGKITESLPETTTTQPGYLDGRLSIISGPVTRIQPRIWESLANAMRENRSTLIAHRTPHTSDLKERRFDPYQIIHYQEEWYAKGFDHQSGEIRTFAISRIERARKEKETFQVPDDYDYTREAGMNFDLMWGETVYTVKLAFDAQLAPYIQEREWHPSQQIETRKDGSIIFTMETRHLLEIKRWVMSWGDGVTVLGPESLARDLRDECTRILERYN